jgi:hypothetical protein
MQLSAELRRRLVTDTGQYATEACDHCGRILGPVRFTRKDETGVWCSRLCRDGEIAAAKHEASRKGRCVHCGLALSSEERTDAKYCDAACKKAAQRSRLSQAA